MQENFQKQKWSENKTFYCFWLKFVLYLAGTDNQFALHFGGTSNQIVLYFGGTDNQLSVPPKYRTNWLPVPPKYRTNWLSVPAKYSTNLRQKKLKIQCSETFWLLNFLLSHIFMLIYKTQIHSWSIKNRDTPPLSDMQLKSINYIIFTSLGLL